MAGAPMTVVETGEFLRQAKGLMTDLERETMLAYLAANPEAGEIMPETGGLRKIRWALRGAGKRGGARVIYYYCGDHLPLFLLSIFAKSQKENLTKAERNEMKRLVPMLVSRYARER
jgi:hypothetical protein